MRKNPTNLKPTIFLYPVFSSSTSSQTSPSLPEKIGVRGLANGGCGTLLPHHTFPLLLCGLSSWSMAPFRDIHPPAPEWDPQVATEKFTSKDPSWPAREFLLLCLQHLLLLLWVFCPFLNISSPRHHRLGWWAHSVMWWLHFAVSCSGIAQSLLSFHRGQPCSPPTAKTLTSAHKITTYALSVPLACIKTWQIPQNLSEEVKIRWYWL